jgi:YihY family inner membrane protein
MANPIDAALRRVDRLQRRNRWLAFAVGVVKKFGDDEAGKQAALIAYYGFFSLFPLLLVLVTVLGFLVGSSSDFANDVLHSVLSRFPIIGDQIQQNVHSLKGNGLALAVGIAGALWGGMAVVRAAQGAMDTVWNVPRKERPNMMISRLRALVLLVVFGVGIIVSTALAGVATAVAGKSFWGAIAVLAVTTLVNFALFLAAFQLLTVAAPSWRQLVPGAVVAAIFSVLLQTLGSYLVGHTLKGASQTYGFFAVVIGMLTWIYLQAQLFLLAAEVNVVAAYDLWPRSLTGDRTDADEAALTALAKIEERQPTQVVEVTFDDAAVTDASAASREGGAISRASETEPSTRTSP